jgi:prepilin peptidase CpaA
LISPTSSQLLFAGCATACAGTGSVFDLRERRVPNWLTAPAFLSAIIAHGCSGGWSGLGDSVLAALIAGLAFFLFHLAGGMGAGDVKLIAACAAFVGIPYLSGLLLSTCIAGGLFAIAVGLYRGVLRQTFAKACGIVAHHGARGLVPHPEMNLSTGRGIRLPFAVPIAAGCAITLAMEAVAR